MAAASVAEVRTDGRTLDCRGLSLSLPLTLQLHYITFPALSLPLLRADEYMENLSLHDAGPSGGGSMPPGPPPRTFLQPHGSMSSYLAQRR